MSAPADGRRVSLMAFDLGGGEPGPLAVVICALCRALVIEDGQARHDAVHRAALRDEAEKDAIEHDDRVIDFLAEGGEPTSGDVVDQMLAALRDEVDEEDHR